VIGIQSFGIHQEVDQRRINAAAPNQIINHPGEFAAVSGRQLQYRMEASRLGNVVTDWSIWEVCREPMQSGLKVALLEMNDQIYGAATTATLIPVDELLAANRDNALACMPLVSIISIGNGIQ
jgi:hypothetical protein